MKKNMGSVDRWIRMIVGILLLSLLYTDLSFKYIGYIGIIPIITGLFRICPLYSIFKISTCPIKNKK